MSLEFLMECPVRACTHCEHSTGLQGWCRIASKAGGDSASLGPRQHLRVLFLLFSNLFRPISVSILVFVCLFVCLFVCICLSVNVSVADVMACVVVTV